MQGEATDTAVEEDFPEMVVPQDDQWLSTWQGGKQKLHGYRLILI
jgi:hypothetical protein